MKFALCFSLLLLLFSQRSPGFDLSPGKEFPNLVLPPIDGGEAMAVDSFFGEKLMLHVFASW